MSTQELLPCPFCGAPCKSDTTGGRNFIVAAHTYPCPLYGDYPNLQPDRWNMRSASPEIDNLKREQKNDAIAYKAAIDRQEELRAERDQVNAESQDLRMLVKEMDLTFGRYLLGMRAAVVEWQKGKGADAAMEWIWNGLRGPGELPPEEETEAQAYFDREVVKIEEGLEEVYAYRDKRRSEKANNTKEAQ